MTNSLLSISSRWESVFNTNKKEKNYEKLMDQPQKLGKIIANKTVKDVIKKTENDKYKKY